ncbi:hypothetical protein AMS68_007261 [Peltaster fructicola]|uniref:Heterokaryon incompatibility domain-containing protein n=1 Tax=Peltaster fructicola TaxID=286661 RepID=A0A6H0Y408_9PEZI|nr:hypothetical protein AMS68_007261 [Peltaster fructicola]
MGTIYEQAAKTIVWLGDGNEQTTAAFALLMKLRKLAEYRSLIAALAECTPVEALQHAQVVVNAVDAGTELGDGIAGVFVVLKRAWFSRLWTVQEVVVAKSQLFYCGQDSCSLDDIVALATLAEYYERSCWQIRNMVRAAKMLWKYAVEYRKHQRSPLWTLLDAFSQTLYVCSEPHDRIYALLALQPSSSEPEHCAIAVDYQLPMTKVVQQATEAMIKCTRSLDVLQSRGLQETADVPHWVPSWSAATGISRVRRNHTPFTASKTYPHVWEGSTDGILSVRGRQLTRIEDTTVLMVSKSRDEALDDFLKTGVILPWYEALLSQKGHSRVEPCFLNLLARTLTCGWAQMDEPARHEKTTEAQLFALLDKLGGRSALHRCHQRRLASLEGVAMIALVPAEAQADDVICVVHGSTTPLVLRMAAQKYEYIGACFVEGMMYGEAVDWLEAEASALELV